MRSQYIYDAIYAEKRFCVREGWVLTEIFKTGKLFQ